MAKEALERIWERDGELPPWAKEQYDGYELIERE